MKQNKWKAGGLSGRRIRTRNWMIGFMWGLLLVVLVRGVVYVNELRSAALREQQLALTQVTESAPPKQEENVPDKRAASNKKDEPSKSVQASVSGSSIEAHNKLSAYDKLWVDVYVSEDKRIEKMPIELYVRGVLAGEMPIDFELEALKAQAIAARTYIYRRLLAGESSGPSDKADVDDTIQNQVYIPLGELIGRWSGAEKDANLKKLNEAVEETKGQIVTYKGKPIEASFFSTSNGYTENASDYWDMDLPYLKSVSSPWDKAISPKYKETITMDLDDFSHKLDVKSSDVLQMRIMDITSGHRIKTIRIGRESFSGREVREKLGLASSQFIWTIIGDQIRITTFGYGHGVGMSQWGANGMAMDGKSAAQILAHYYTGTKLEKANGVLE
ncbi:stage II sporulation protein D [Paenibacillus taihuensis]|uniref:Stage II sporulation protein D n=1 Tax=Paenibacillus taihuensis TaxID=1156355 RepID=A0A3D9SKM6_9BACL|nr:stage II sporulation protein D [Paenibacillus taihuensis]REE91470.1 stage II sporulation protein D [Paenibacillus taihuensis]